MPRGVVFDTGALDDLLDERRRRIFAEAARASRFELVVPAVVVPEFLTGHRGDEVRARRVLNVFRPVAVTPEVAERAAFLLSRVSRVPQREGPHVIDAIVAALAETYGAVATRDRHDFAALAAAGVGFDVYDLTELRIILEPAERKQRPRRRRR